MLIFSCLRFWLYSHLAKKKEKKDSQCFSCICNGFCADRLDVNGNMHICTVCHSLTCPIYTHIVFCLEQLEAACVEHIKSNNNRMRAQIGLCVGKKTLFFLYSLMVIYLSGGPVMSSFLCLVFARTHFNFKSE